jgi:serine/threonine-protein kinase
MKTKTSSVIFMLFLSMTSISFGADQSLDTLNEAVRRIAVVLSDADRSLQEAAGRIGKGLDAQADIRADVRNLCAGKPYVIDCSFLNAKGVMQIVEPEKFRKFEGSNLAAQAVTARILRVRKPVFSELFVGIEEVHASLLAYPVFNMNKEFVGSVGIFFSPELLVRKAIEGLTIGKGVVVIVLEADGMNVYSTDPAQVRRSPLKHAEYQGFPELQGLVGMIVSQEEGAGTYQYVRPGTHQVVRKKAAWKTVSLYDGFWRVVIAEEEKPRK